MTDAKKNENSKAAVAELLGERKRPWSCLLYTSDAADDS